MKITLTVVVETTSPTRERDIVNDIRASLDRHVDVVCGDTASLSAVREEELSQWSAF